MDAEDIEEELLNLRSELEHLQEHIEKLSERRDSLIERESKLKSFLKRKLIKSSVNICSSKEKWSGQFSWDERASDHMLEVFGISSYRTNQREIINAVMSGRDVLVLMAAGGGKSLCYQLPAELNKGITLVVSPLLSLIHDQVQGLFEVGIPAFSLTSTTSKANEKLIYNALEGNEGNFSMLYVTPEKISKSKRFMSKLEKCYHSGNFSLIAIDEAHCCSQWGHDFRPDYKNLGILKTQFPKVPMIALTATATKKAQIDMMEMLHIMNCEIFSSTVNRPNLFYMVREKSSVAKVVLDEIAEFIKSSYRENESGIIYCFSRKECEQVAIELKDRGVSADYYHADMDVSDREIVHQRWSSDDFQVIVATVAFGMGIDKPDVRFVIHHSLSKSLETYYQESGRAGRDGLRSDCLLYFRPGDVPKQSSMVFYENYGLENLYDMVHYCQANKECRRNAFFKHFEESFQDCNGMCDNCAFPRPLKELDATEEARTMVSLLQNCQGTDKRLTMLQVVDKVHGKHKDPGLGLKRCEIEQLVIQLLLDHILKEEFRHTPYSTNAYVTTGPLCEYLMTGKTNIRMKIVQDCERVRIEDISKPLKLTLSLLEKNLLKLRAELSSSFGVTPRSVLSSLQIQVLAVEKPTSLTQLRKTIGRVRADKYGTMILEEINRFQNENNNDENRGGKRHKITID